MSERIEKSEILIDKVEKLKNFMNWIFIDGVACGVATSTGIALILDKYDNGNLDHPYLIGIPLGVSMIVGAYNQIKYRHNGRGLEKLARELELYKSHIEKK